MFIMENWKTFVIMMVTLVKINGVTFESERECNGNEMDFNCDDEGTVLRITSVVLFWHTGRSQCDSAESTGDRSSHCSLSAEHLDPNFYNEVMSCNNRRECYATPRSARSSNCTTGQNDAFSKYAIVQYTCQAPSLTSTMRPNPPGRPDLNTTTEAITTTVTEQTSQTDATTVTTIQPTVSTAMEVNNTKTNPRLSRFKKRLIIGVSVTVSLLLITLVIVVIGACLYRKKKVPKTPTKQPVQFAVTNMTYNTDDIITSDRIIPIPHLTPTAPPDILNMSGVNGYNQSTAPYDSLSNHYCTIVDDPPGYSEIQPQNISTSPVLVVPKDESGYDTVLHDNTGYVSSHGCVDTGTDLVDNPNYCPAGGMNDPSVVYSQVDKVRNVDETILVDNKAYQS